jgi:ribosomal protein S18 acetylase RimI-like enzyme
MLVANRDCLAVGLAMAQLDEAECETVLYMLYVHPQWQRQGVGSALLRAVVASFSDAKAIRLEVLKDNAPAISWYKAKGFETYGETENATNTRNVAALYMQKRLERTSAPSAPQC